MIKDRPVRSWWAPTLLITASLFGIAGLGVPADDDDGPPDGGEAPGEGEGEPPDEEEAGAAVAKNCCLCVYENDIGCAGYEPDTCVDPHLGGPNCGWDSEQGLCRSRFQMDCEAITWDPVCDVYVPSEVGEDPTPQLQGCTDLRYYYSGHGPRCEALCGDVIVCAHNITTCTNIVALDGSCSTFGDLCGLQGWIDTLVAECPGVNISVTAQQATANPPLGCVSPYTVNISADGGVTQGPGSCINEFEQTGACFEEGETALCTTEGGDEVTKTCCCRDPGNDEDGPGTLSPENDCLWVIGAAAECSQCRDYLVNGPRCGGGDGHSLLYCNSEGGLAEFHCLSEGRTCVSGVDGEPDHCSSLPGE